MRFVTEDKLNRNLSLSLLVCLLAISCSSWVKSTRKMINDEENAQKKWVHVNQYNDVVEKNKILEQKIEILEGQLSPNSRQVVEQDNKRDEMITEVVDLSTLTTPEPAKKVVQPAPVVVASPKTIEQEVDLYQKAMLLKNNGNLDDAIKILNRLNQAKSKQVLVRVKNQLGHIYQAQEQYDLAVQVYKEVIENYAFSGVVIESLSGIVECYDKLGLSNEKLKYQSLKELLGANA